MKHFVYGDRYRIFLNTALGCPARCQYCYLPGMGLGHAPKYISAEDTLAMLKQLDVFIPGPQGTIFSLGCYSECWDDQNKPETIKLLSYLSIYGNYIQLATKQMISKEELNIIDSLALYPGQIGIYLSIPTLSRSEELEPGTALPQERLAPLKWKEEFENIYFILYIKPVIPSITLDDGAIYGHLMKIYQLSTVVGPLLAKGTGNTLVGEGDLKEISSDESGSLRNMLEQYGSVYTHSTQIIDNLRAQKVDIFRWRLP